MVVSDERLGHTFGPYCAAHCGSAWATTACQGRTQERGCQQNRTAHRGEDKIAVVVVMALVHRVPEVQARVVGRGARGVPGPPRHGGRL